MLIDFTVENYRSIKDPVTLSAIAVKRGGRKSSGTRRPGVVPDNEIAAPCIVGGRGLELLPVLGIFGANASGKTNVLKALDFLTTFMLLGRNASNDSVHPFAFHVSDQDTEDQEASPTRFNLRLVCGGNLYTYSLKILGGFSGVNVLDESLEYTPVTSKRNAPKRLFVRTWDTSAYDWYVGKDLGNRSDFLRIAIRSGEPFMSFLLDRISHPITEPIRNWLMPRWPGIREGGQDEFESDIRNYMVHHMDASRLLEAGKMLKRFDTGVLGIEHDGSMEHPEQFFTLHKDKSGREKYIPLEWESHGTQRLLVISFRMLEALDTGSLFIIDELEASLHPNITAEIVKLFQDPETNPKRAQLIFTSHDNTLLDNNLLRRDQVWFTDKGEDGSTDLYSLADFKPRNDLAIDKAYLDGRFGAVPFLPTHELFFSDVLEAA